MFDERERAYGCVKMTETPFNRWVFCSCFEGHEMLSFNVLSQVLDVPFSP